MAPSSGKNPSGPGVPSPPARSWVGGPFSWGPLTASTPWMPGQAGCPGGLSAPGPGPGAPTPALPGVEGGVLVVASDRVYGLPPGAGKELWPQPRGLGSRVVADLAAAGGV